MDKKTMNPSKNACWYGRNLDQNKRKTQNHESLERWQETKEKTCLKKSGLNSNQNHKNPRN